MSQASVRRKRVGSLTLWATGFVLVALDSTDSLQRAFSVIPDGLKPYMSLFTGITLFGALILLHSAHQDDLDALASATEVNLSIERVDSVLMHSYRYVLVLTIRVNNVGEPTSLTGWKAAITVDGTTTNLEVIPLHQTHLSYGGVSYSAKDDATQSFVHEPVPKNAITFAILILDDGKDEKFYRVGAVLTVTCRDVREKEHATTHVIRDKYAGAPFPGR